MGPSFSDLVSAPFNAVSDAFHGNAPSLPGAPGLSGSGGFNPLLDHGGLEALLQFPLNPLFPVQQQPAQGPSAEERLESFKDSKGQALWKTEQQKQALLKILQQDPSMTVEKFQRGQEMAALAGLVYPMQDDKRMPRRRLRTGVGSGRWPRSRRNSTIPSYRPARRDLQGRRARAATRWPSAAPTT